MSPAPSEMALFSTTESVAEWAGPPHRTEQQTAPTSRRGAWSAQNKTFVSWLQIERGPFSHNQPAFCCEQNTHPNSTYRCAQWVTTHTGRIDRISSREHTWLKLDGSVIAHLCVPKLLSSTCHVSFPAAPDTDHKHKFSLTYLAFLSEHQIWYPITQHTQDLWYTIHIFSAKFHGRVADQHKSHLSQVMSPKPSRPKRSSLKTSSLE